MYFQRLIERNPQLLEAALSLHQNGRIPPNTWIIDLDMIVENARILFAEAMRLGLTTYLMSKQYGRNPYVSALALANGLYKIVAVDVTCSLMARRYARSWRGATVSPLGTWGTSIKFPVTWYLRWSLCARM